MKTVGVILSWDQAFFGVELRKLRAGLGLTARESAWQAGIRPSTWYSWEKMRKMPSEASKTKLREWMKSKGIAKALPAGL